MVQRRWKSGAKSPSPLRASSSSFRSKRWLTWPEATTGRTATSLCRTTCRSARSPFPGSAPRAPCLTRIASRSARRRGQGIWWRTTTREGRKVDEKECRGLRGMRALAFPISLDRAFSPLDSTYFCSYVSGARSMGFMERIGRRTKGGEEGGYRRVWKRDEGDRWSRSVGFWKGSN